MMREPVDVARQHAIHDDHIVRLACGEEHAVAAVAGVIGGVARFLQPLDHELADPLVVLDQQNFHGASPSRAAVAGGGRGARPHRARRVLAAAQLNRSRYR